MLTKYVLLHHSLVKNEKKKNHQISQHSFIFWTAFHSFKHENSILAE